MTKNQGWTRRQFSQALAVSAAASLLPRFGNATQTASLAGLAFIGSAPAEGSPGGIHVYRVSGSGWRRTQSLPAAAPGRLLLHPSLPVLYALHDVAEWNHLPRGAVSAYTIDGQGGQLVPLGTQPLSLSATHPRDAVLTADGSHLFIAAERGGMYNLLPVGANGNLLPVALIRKEFGLGDGEGAKVAAPCAIALHPDGNLLSVDHGQESLTSFQLQGSKLAVQHRERVHPGSGATQISVSACGKCIYTLDRTGRTITTYTLKGKSLVRLKDIFLEQSQAQSIVLAPGGRYLLASGEGSTTVFQIAPAIGLLSRHTQLHEIGQRLSFATDAGHLLGLDVRTGVVRQTAFDPVHGTAASLEAVARVQNGVSLVFRPAGPVDARVRPL